jgi:hypothetical protein
LYGGELAHVQEPPGRAYGLSLEIALYFLAKLKDALRVGWSNPWSLYTPLNDTLVRVRQENPFHKQWFFLKQDRRIAK